MHTTKFVILLVASLLFLVAGLIYISISERPAVAYSPAFCFTRSDCKDRVCTDKPYSSTTCCWTSADYRVCQTCTLNKNTGYYDSCSRAFGDIIISLQPANTHSPYYILYYHIISQHQKYVLMVHHQK
jgi:hypothetical protein